MGVSDDEKNGNDIFGQLLPSANPFRDEKSSGKDEARSAYRRGPRTTKARVAVEPFKDTSVKTTAVGEGAVKVGRIDNTAGRLVTLRVLFDSEDYRFKAGQRVLVQPNLYQLPWAKAVQELDGVRFVLMPVEHVEVITDG